MTDYSEEFDRLRYPGEHFRATDSSESVKPVGIPINMEESI